MIRSFEGKTPRIHPTAFISEAAYVIGDVEIGEGSSIWPGAVIRADLGPIAIGAYSAVEDNSLVHGTPIGLTRIGDHTVIGHNVVVHSERVGDYCLIGNGVILLEGAKVDDWCVIAAGAVVVPRMQIAARSFVVGNPAEVRSELQPRHEQIIEYAWKIQVDLAKRHMIEGTGAPAK